MNWPCETAEAYELFDLLSGTKVPVGLRAAVGRFMHKHGYFKTNEFPAAERRLKEYPQAQWKVETASPGEWHEPVDVHYRSLLVLAASVMRHPRCDPSKHLVWGPEVQTDADTGRCPIGHSADLCNSAWCAARAHATSPRPRRRVILRLKTCFVRLEPIGGRG